MHRVNAISNDMCLSLEGDGDGMQPANAIDHHPVDMCIRFLQGFRPSADCVDCSHFSAASSGLRVIEGI